MSAASFLGITGLVAFYGFDGFMYSVGWLVAYLAVLFLVAEPLRNTGKYTMADVISFRLRGRGVRAIAAVSTLADHAVLHDRANGRQRTALQLAASAVLGRTSRSWSSAS